MKSVEEIQEILVSELRSYLNKIKSLNPSTGYYNAFLGDTSFLLAGLLGSLLKFKEDWDSEKWIDDSLLMKINLNQNKISIWGAVILGVENVTEQWTEPFYFEIELSQTEQDFNEYTFLFSDLGKPKKSYEEFIEDRNCWDPTDKRDWRYVICQKKN